MIMFVDRHAALERKVRSRISADDAHHQISLVLAEVAVAAIHPSRRGSIAGGAMESLIEEPVAMATRAAIETLIDELEDLVDSLPASELDHLALEQLEADLGFE
jgi:hypothetical protein